MKRAVELELIEEIASHLREGTTTRVAEPKRIPVDELVSQPRVADEAHALFSQFPAVVAPAALLKDPGDFVVEQHHQLPLLVTRDADGQARVFANVCRHRGNTLCVEASGNAKVFTCEYHAWSYGLDGQCRSMVDMESFTGVDLADSGLAEYPSEERHGLIWFLPQVGGTLDVRSYLGDDLDDELAGYQEHARHVYRGEESEVDFNWKFAVNTFQELFHLNYLHKDSLEGAFIGNRATFHPFDPHHRVIAVRGTFPEMLEQPEDEHTVLPHAAIIYTLFPNTVLVWQIDHLEIWKFSPIAGDPYRSSVRLWLLTEHEPATEGSRRHWQQNWDITRRVVLDEDFVAMQRIQDNLLSGATDSIVYGRNEPGLQHFHEQITASLAAD